MRAKEKRLNAFMFKTCWNKDTLFFSDNAVSEMKKRWLSTNNNKNKNKEFEKRRK